jgi:hypothetical protein
VQAALDRAEVPYQLVDENSLHTIDAGTKALVLPTLRRVDGGLWAALHALSATGMRIVIGPELPREDELGVPLGPDAVQPSGSGLIAAETLDDIDELSGAMLDLAGELSDLWIAPEAEAVDCSIYCDDGDAPRALFVGNSRDEAQAARVNVPEACVLRDAITGEECREEAGIAAISLAPYQVRLFVVQP